MKVLFFILLVTTATSCGVIGSSLNGMVVTLKEKYGCAIQDTCLVVTILDGLIYTTHKDKPSGVYSVYDWAIINCKKL